MGRLRVLIGVALAVIVALVGFVSFQPSKQVIAVTQVITQQSALNASAITVDRAPISEYVDTITVAQAGIPAALTVDLAVDHAAVADLLVLLEHVPTGTMTRLVNHLGGDVDVACAATRLNVTLDATAETTLDAVCADGVISGAFRPFTVDDAGAFADFMAIEDMRGDWRLIIHDYGAGVDAFSVEWALNIEFVPTLLVAQTEDPNPDPVDPVDPGNGDDTPTTSTPVFATNVGLVQMSTVDAQPVYQSPAGETVKINGIELYLPKDADGSGFDTYVVTGIAAVGDEVWVAVFVGGPNAVWLPLDAVTPLLYLGEDDLFSDDSEASNRILVPQNVRYGLAE